MIRAGQVQSKPSAGLSEEPTDTPQLLVIDDDDDSLSILKMVFKKEGYQVDLANDGLEGLKLLKAKHHDVVISDVMMPKMDGYKFCEEVRSDPAIQSTPIILITAKKETIDKITGLEKGADDYVTKPYNLIELRARILAMLRMKRLRDELTAQQKELERIKTLEETLLAISHNINNAIAPIFGRAQICSPDDTESVEKLVEASLEGCRKVKETMELLEKVIGAMKNSSNQSQFLSIQELLAHLREKGQA